MRLLRLIFIAGVFLASLHFSFFDVKAADGNGIEEPVEGIHNTSKDGALDEESELEDADGIHTVDEGNETKVVEEQPADSDTQQAEEPSATEELAIPKDENTKSVSEEVEEVETEEQVTEEVTTFSTFSAPVATVPYKQGDRHEDLIDIKKQLNAIGFDGISETNYFGNWTKTRVLQFQAYYGLSETEEIDQKTIDKIASVYHSPFQLGKRHESTIELKEKLNALGYGHISVTNLYGDWTVNRVKKFQRENGLRVNGIADEPTWAKINELISQMEFKVGDRHPNIIIIKQKLNAIGFDRISETDYYGSWTKTRVTQFQEYYGLQQTGTTNKQTLDKLDEVYNSPFQLNKRHESTIELKEKLNTLGYGHITVTDLYGSWTVNRVKKFQRENGLHVNGIADERTWEKINELMEEYLSQTEFKVGDSHPNIVLIKQKLNALGFDRISETEYYGSWTRTRVMQFQEYYGLPKTGTTNQVTMDKLNEVYNSPFQLGQRHESTKELKEKLNSLGYGHISVTTLYGSFTKKQVKKFQQDHGLKDHGIADGKTWEKLDELLRKTEFKLGDHHPGIASLKAKLNFVGFDGISETNYFGNWTKTRVEQFQAYYGVPITGELDKATNARLDEIYNSPYQLGKSHENLIDIKKKLNELGYGHITVTENFGSWTKNRVIKFQKDHDLVPNGIIDEVTLREINQQYDNNNIIEKFAISLEEALTMQMKVAPQTDHAPGYINAKFAVITGEVTGTSHVRTEPTTNSKSIATLSKGTKVTILERVKGEKVSTTDNWYKIRYKGKDRYIYGNLVTNITAKINSDINLRVRADNKSSSLTYAVLPANTVVRVADFEDNGWVEIGVDWRNAHKDNVIRFLDPTLNDAYQHLDLSYNLGFSTSQLNTFLETLIGDRDGSVLKGKGKTFRDAAAIKDKPINEVYLIAHALLETGYGTSNLATGKIEVGEISANKWVAFVPDKKGNIVPYTGEIVVIDGKTKWIIKEEKDFKRSSAKNIQKIHNMFGIDAVDSHPEIRGAIYAYRQQWFNVDAAITGGAQFIANDYIHNQYNQNTLYKMRWNPTAMETLGYATKQYASDIRWAVKQVVNIKDMFARVDLLDSPLLKFNFIQYK